MRLPARDYCFGFSCAVGHFAAQQQPAHPAQFPPQEDFPAFLSLTMRTTIKVTTPTNAARTNSQPKLAPSHANI